MQRRFSKHEDIEKNESEPDKNKYIFHSAKNYDEDQVAVIQQMTKNKSDLKGVKDRNRNTHKASLKGKKQHTNTTKLALKAKRNVNVNIL